MLVTNKVVPESAILIFLLLMLIDVSDRPSLIAEGLSGKNRIKFNGVEINRVGP